ncbi:MAG: hypothetical protein JKY22_02670 [Flavobacteriaceae bacterium]|nr:hypothetical protein [Flavobacteriaceae bacterium]
MKCIFNLMSIILAFIVLGSCETKVEREYLMEPCPENEKSSKAAQIKKLKEGGYEIFDYVDEKTGDTIIMQEYFMAFLKRGPNRDWTKQESDSLQVLHRGHLGRMYEEGYADISGPFGDDQDVRGITIYNVPTLKMADSLANIDPSVQAGSLMIEVRSWWAIKGHPLR